MKSIVEQPGARAKILPSPEALERFGTLNMLALIHDAVGHLVSPILRLPEAITVLEQIAESLIVQQLLLKEVLTVREDAASVSFTARKREEIPPVSYSVVRRDLRFVSVSESYARMFRFSQAELRDRSFNELLRPSDIRRFSTVIRPLLKGKVGSCKLVEWRATGTGQFVLTKDTLWGIDTGQVRGPEYIATVSQKIDDRDEAAMLVDRANSRIRRTGDEQ